MIYITLTLQDSEWERIRGVARNYWPNEPLERQLSKNEACRRLLMGGLTSLQATSAANQKQTADAYARPINPPADTDVGPYLPGAPR